MKIGFYGAARNVTGSKHLIMLDNGTNILLDCGMFQGMGSINTELNETFGFDAKEVSVVVLSHAHIDHSGLLPKLVKEGFTGKIYCTEATRDLTAILLEDSASIQEMEARRSNEERKKHNLDSTQPLYTTEDVATTIQRFECIGFEERIKLNDDVELSFTHTGHLVGSAAVHLAINENGKTTRISYSGDIGRYLSLLMKAPEPFEQADIILLESTYGDTHRGLLKSSMEDLYDWIHKTCINKNGKLIIPAFSVGRTQELLYLLNQMELEKRLPDIGYYVDSPLSIKATAVIKKYTDDFGNHLQEVLKTDNDPFDFKGLHYVETVEDSQKLEALAEPCVIISASGTADAGRVRHHIFNVIDDMQHAVLIVGYCEAKSLGGQLLNGAESINMMGETFDVKAEIGKMTSMSAHGDCDDLLRWISCQDAEKVKQVFLVHGEPTPMQYLKDKLELKGFKHVEMPKQGDVVEL